MNQPDRFEKFVVPEGVPKIKHIKDTRIAHAGTFIAQREDHTLGNMIRTQLHRDRDVVFAGYKIPHPLMYECIVKVQTNGRKTPVKAMEGALDDIHSEFYDIKSDFMRLCDQHQPPQF